jgi:uncharacterized membrane protein YgcG
MTTLSTAQYRRARAVLAARRRVGTSAISDAQIRLALSSGELSSADCGTASPDSGAGSSSSSGGGSSSSSGGDGSCGGGGGE